MINTVYSKSSKIPPPQSSGGSHCTEKAPPVLAIAVFSLTFVGGSLGVSVTVRYEIGLLHLSLSAVFSSENAFDAAIR